MSDFPLSQAFYMATQAVAGVLGVTPLPAGLSTAQVGEWSLTINNGREPLRDHEGLTIDPWHIVGRHSTFLAVTVLSPVGGVIGGCSEDDFIADMEEAGAVLAE